MARDEALPFLNLSGILSVRRQCISIVGDSQHRIATGFMHDDIPALLGEIELWVQSGAGTMTAERRLAIRQLLDTLDERLTNVTALHSGPSLVTSLEHGVP